MDLRSLMSGFGISVQQRKENDMNKKLLVVADLGHFKAYKLEQNESFSQPRLQLLEEWDTDVPRHLSEELSDQAGQFRKDHRAGNLNGGPSNLSDGEQHN